jgi:microcystin-dependent protein
MAFNQIVSGIGKIDTAFSGNIGISLTNFTASAASNIAAGSYVVIDNAYFLADADVVPNASSWTAITTATTAYLALVASGSAGSQILTASWVSTPPVWDTTKQYWSATAPSQIRVVASAYKVGATSYSNKRILNNSQNNLQFDLFPVGFISMYDGSGWVDNYTLPNWYACISANAGVGCPDLVDRFILGKVVAGSGATGGSNLHTLTSAELPPHTHTIPRFNTSGAYVYAMVSVATRANDESTGNGGFANTAIDMHPAYYSVIYIRKCY